MVYEYDPAPDKWTKSDRSGFARLSLIVFLALVPHSEDTHPVAGLDLEQCHIASGTEGNDELSQERVVTVALRQEQGENCSNSTAALIESSARAAVLTSRSSSSKSSSGSGVNGTL